MIQLSLLGTGGTMPLPNRWLTSLIFRYKKSSILVDCGEGTQVTLKQLGWKTKSIDAILFTHFHADHIAGLPGMLFSIANSNRTEPLQLFGPPGLKKIVEGLTVIAPRLPFELIISEISDQQGGTFSLNDLNDIQIHYLPIDHTISCFAYSFEIKRTKRFNREKAEFNQVPKKYWSTLQKGKGLTVDGILYTPEMVLGEDRKGIRISYCTDTRPIEELIPFVEDSNLFICEGMYGSDEDLPKAVENKHMLFSEAAILADKANVNELWLTHFSPSLQEPEVYLHDIKSIFPNAKVGEDRMFKELKFEK